MSPAAVAPQPRARHEGLLVWAARAVLSAPRAVVSIVRGIALEIASIVRGGGRAALAVVPGASRIGSMSRPGRLPKLEAAPGLPDIVRPRRTPAQERVHTERRQLMRSRLRLAAGIGVLAALLSAIVLIPRSQAFQIRHIEVSGTRAVSDLEVRTRIDRMLEDQTIFTVDTDAMVRRIEELPFVREARIDRHLPGGLELVILEYQPLALGYGSGGFWLISHDGRLLAKARSEEWAGQVPTIMLQGTGLKAGARIDDEPAMQLLRSVPARSTVAFELVEADSFSVRGRLSSGVDVRFGRPDQLTQKVLVLEKVLRDAARRKQSVRYVDVSVPSRPAICVRDSVACNLPRGVGTARPAASPEVAATTPEERGGDLASVTAAVGRIGDAL